MMKAALKSVFSLLFILNISTATFCQWTQIGDDIDGEASDDQSGSSVSMSSDGSVVAIGAIRNHANDDLYVTGHVRIYKYVGSSWAQVGSDIDGDDPGAQFGWSVSLNETGDIVAVGAGTAGYNGETKIFQFNGTDWVQLGQTIEGESIGDLSGYAVSLNSDGTRIAIGATFNDGSGIKSGHVRVFQYNGSNWVQLGNDIDGEAADDRSGCAVSISSNGSIVAIGATWNDGNGQNSGHARVFQYNGSNWVQMGNDINGEANEDRCGDAVSISADGMTVAVGAYYNDGGEVDSGHVRVFQYNGSYWIQKGGNLDGESNGDFFGVSVALNSDGSIVLIGAHLYSGNGVSAGYAKTYNYSGSVWQQLGNQIDGENAGDMCGQSIAISSNGHYVALGAPNNDGVGSNAGHVRVFGYSTYVPDNQLTSEFVFYPNPTANLITIAVEEVIQIEILNTLGEIEIKTTSKQIDLSDFHAGIYFIRIHSRSGTITGKIIKL